MDLAASRDIVAPDGLGTRRHVYEPLGLPCRLGFPDFRKGKQAITTALYYHPVFSSPFNQYLTPTITTCENAE